MNGTHIGKENHICRINLKYKYKIKTVVEVKHLHMYLYLTFYKEHQLFTLIFNHH
jgi:hypothetical protein